MNGLLVCHPPPLPPPPFNNLLNRTLRIAPMILYLPLFEKYEGYWVKISFAKTSGIVTRDRGKINIGQQLTSTSTVSIPETIVGCISVSAAGTLNGSILDTFFFLRWNSTRIIRNVKGKGVAAAPFAHPQTRPGMHFSSRAQLFEDRLALLNLRLNFNLLRFFLLFKSIFFQLWTTRPRWKGSNFMEWAYRDTFTKN